MGRTRGPRRGGGAGPRRAAGALALAVLWSAASGPPAGAAAGDSGRAPRPIALAGAVALARQNAPATIQAGGEVRATGAGVRSSLAAFLPSVSLSAGATRQYPSRPGATRVENGQVITLPSEPWSHSASVGGTLVLFAGGQRLFDLKEARANADIARAGQVSQRFGVDLDVKGRFYNVLAARESDAAARAQLDQAGLQWRTAVTRVRARTATRSDSLRAEIQLRSAQLAVAEAEDALRVADAALTRSVGTPYPVTAAPEDSIGTPALALPDDALWQMAEEAPSVREAAARLEAARAVRKSAWTGYLPTVSASYSRAASGTSSEFALGADDYDYSGSLRLSLSLPLWNQLQREERVVRAQVSEENARAGLRDARLAVRESLTRSLGAFRTAGTRVEAQAASVDAAEEDLRVQQQRYAIGEATLLDVLTSQAQLVEARRALIRARYDQRVAKAELEALVGRDL